MTSSWCCTTQVQKNKHKKQYNRQELGIHAAALKHSTNHKPMHKSNSFIYLWFSDTFDSVLTPYI